MGRVTKVRVLDSERVVVDDSQCVICNCVLSVKNRSKDLKNVCRKCKHDLEF